MELIKNAELFAKMKHSGKMKKDGITTYSEHLEEIVNRLKGLGVTDEEILCAGWLHDIIEDTDVSFDNLFEKFGTRISVLVLSLSKNTSLPKKQREQEYIKQLKEAINDVKIIKLCDISANLSTLKKYNTSRSKKIRIVKQLRQYFVAIKNDLDENKKYPKTTTLLESVNRILKQFSQKNIPLNHQNKKQHIQNK